MLFGRVTVWNARYLGNASLPLILVSITVFSVLVLSAEDVVAFVTTWFGDASFGHGVLVVPISLYLVWTRRHRLRHISPSRSLLGIFLVIVSAVVWVIGEAARVQLVQQFALVGIVQGVVWAVIGTRLTRSILFPLVFLYFAVPFGASIVPFLQTVTAEIVVRLVSLFGIPVHQDGVFIHLPGSSFEVAAACAGFRYLISTTAIGALAANVFFRSLKKRLVFFGIALVVPIFANGVRAFSVVMLVHISDGAYGVDHNALSLVMMSAVTLVIFLGAMRFREGRAIERLRDGATARRFRSKESQIGTAVVAGACMAVVVSAHAYASVFLHRPAIDLRLTIASPQAEGWRSTDITISWTPRFDGADAQLRQAYVSGRETVDVFVAAYSEQTQESEIVSFGNTFFDESAWSAVGASRSSLLRDGREVSVTTLHLSSGIQNRLIWYWYLVGDEWIASPYRVKALQAVQRLLGNNVPATIIAVSTSYELYPAEARDSLSRFVGAMPEVSTLVTGDRVKTPRG